MEVSKVARFRWMALVGMLAAFVWAIIRIGPRIPFPGAWYDGQTWPFPGIADVQAYKRSSPVGYVFANLLGLDQSPWLVSFYFVSGLIAIAVIGVWVYSNIPQDQNRAQGFRLFVLGPIAGVLMLTIGGYDPFTVFGFGLALFAWSKGNRFVVLLAGTYLGLQHFEQALIAVIAWSLIVIALREHLPQKLQLRATPMWLILGALVGKVLLTLAISLNGIDPAEGRLYWLTNAPLLKQAVVGVVNFGPAFLLSLFAGLWGVVALTITLLRTHREKYFFIAAIAVPLIMATITLDHTRVFATVTTPIVAIMVVVVMSAHGSVVPRQAKFMAEALAWVVVPITLQGIDVIYVDPINMLDQWIMFAPKLLPFA